jgi:hypothetical protein
VKYHKLYRQALTTAERYQPLVKAGEIELNRLTVDNAMSVNNTFINAYDGKIDENKFLMNCILILSIKGKLEINELTPDILDILPTIYQDYILFIALMRTPPIPSEPVFYDYTKGEQLQAKKNNFLAIDARLRAYQLETKANFNQPLAKFNVTIASLILNGGLLHAERVATNLTPMLSAILQSAEWAGVQANASWVAKPNQVVRSGFNRLKNSNYPTQTPLNAMLAVRDKWKNQELASIRRQIGIMIRLKKDNLEQYQKNLKAAKPELLENYTKIIGDRPEAGHVETMKRDKAALNE